MRKSTATAINQPKQYFLFECQTLPMTVSESPSKENCKIHLL